MTERTRYLERHRLRSSDLAVDQAYHLEALKRHNASRHGFGVVQGLDLEANGDVVLYAGFAVDRSGRQLSIDTVLVLTAALRIFRECAFGKDRYPPDGTIVSVWVQFAEDQLNRRHAGRYDCGESRSGRLLPHPAVAFHVENEAAAFADGDAVPVGALIWQAGAFRVEDWPVPRVSVMAAVTVGSQRQVEMRLGSSDPGLPQRFALTVTEPDGEIGAFAIHRNGLSRMQSMAATPLDAGACPIISLAPPPKAATAAPSPCGTAPRPDESCPPFSTLEFRKPEPPPPDAPGNFRVYRAESQGKKVTTESLRFDLGAKGQKGDVTGRMVVGFEADLGAPFEEALRVGADGSLAVAHDLIIDGTFFPGLVSADPADLVFKMLMLTANAYAHMGTALNSDEVTIECNLENQVVPAGAAVNFIITIKDDNPATTSRTLSWVVAVVDESSGGIPNTRQLDNLPLSADRPVLFVNTGFSQLGTRELMVRASGEGGVVDWLAENEFDFTVDQPLVLSLGFPPTVPPETEWKYKVRATNPSAVSISWSAGKAVYSDSSDPTFMIPPAALTIAAGGSETLLDATHGGVTVPFEVALAVSDYTMAGGNLKFAKTESAEVRIRKHFDFSFEQALSVAAGSVLDYEITIENETPDALTITAASHRIGVAGAFASAASLVNETVVGNAQKTFALRITAPAQAGSVYLELRFEYNLDAFDWKTKVFRTSVDIT